MATSRKNTNGKRGTSTCLSHGYYNGAQCPDCDGAETCILCGSAMEGKRCSACGTTRCRAKSYKKAMETTKPKGE